jgi:hypothetical protein
MRLLNEPRHTVEHLTNRFAPDTLDVEWIPIVALDPDIILISADPAITRGKQERTIWRQSRLTSFFFAGGFSELTQWKQVAEVVNWWSSIIDEAKGAHRGSGYLLPLRGFRKRPKLIYEPFDSPT